MSSEIVKKRGRKANTNKENTVPKIPQKRGRKPKEFYYQTKKLNNEIFNDETIILHLPISIDDCMNYLNINTTNENKILLDMPKSYKPFNDNEIKSFINNKNEGENSNSIVYNQDTSSYKFLSEYNKTNNDNEIDNNDENNNCSNNKDGITQVLYPSLINTIKYTNKKIEQVNIYNTMTNLSINDLNKFMKKNNNISAFHCWWCSHKFLTYPIPMPFYFDEKNGIFKVKGYFCSFNCCLSYIDKRTTKYEYYKPLLKLMYGRMLGIKHYNSIVIKKAPPQETLNIFGGHLTIEEYRQSFDTLDTCNINSYPVIYVSMQIEEHKIIAIDSDHRNKIKQQRDSSSNIKHNSNNENNIQTFNTYIKKRTNKNIEKNISINNINSNKSNLITSMGLKINAN